MWTAVSRLWRQATRLACWKMNCTSWKLTIKILLLRTGINPRITASFTQLFTYLSKFLMFTLLFCLMLSDYNANVSVFCYYILFGERLMKILCGVEADSFCSLLLYPVFGQWVLKLWWLGCFQLMLHVFMNTELASELRFCRWKRKLRGNVVLYCVTMHGPCSYQCIVMNDALFCCLCCVSCSEDSIMYLSWLWFSVFIFIALMYNLKNLFWNKRMKKRRELTN